MAHKKLHHGEGQQTWASQSLLCSTVSVKKKKYNNLAVKFSCLCHRGWPVSDYTFEAPPCRRVIAEFKVFKHSSDLGHAAFTLTAKVNWSVAGCPAVSEGENRPPSRDCINFHILTARLRSIKHNTRMCWQNATSIINWKLIYPQIKNWIACKLTNSQIFGSLAAQKPSFAP